jgi:chitinase
MFNYMLLLGDILLALKGQGKNETFGLTATVPCSLESMEHIDILALDSVLSEFNLLSFDFQGPWGGVVGANAPLYDPPDREGLSVSSCVTKYVEGGASRNKINIGLSFYGHSYRGGKYIGDKCEADWAGVCTDTQTWQEDDGSPQYHNIYEKMPELTLTFDPKTRSPLASNGAGAVSFDDPHSICLKTEYAMSNAGGILIIDLAADMLDDRSTPLLDAANLKILQPDIECDGRNFEQLFAWREVDGYEHVEPTKKIAEPTYEITEPSHENPEPAYRYICGIGEGNAKDNCSNGSDEAYSCDLGTCPSGMLCFVVLCTKPTQEKIIETSFSKQEPKPKMRPTVLNEIRPVLTASDEARPSSNSSEIFSPRDMDLPDETTTAAAITAPDMSFSCGVDSGHASSCGKSCPNGLIDCPMDHFCFWIKCNAPNSILESTELPTESPISAESAASWEHTTMKYQCGVTRNEALTCSEECGVAWKCSDGKDCYNVPCFTTS